MGFVGGLATTSTTNRRHGEAVTGWMRRPPLWFAGCIALRAIALGQTRFRAGRTYNVDFSGNPGVTCDQYAQAACRRPGSEMSTLCS
jgi:hypothetical protein